MKLLRIALILFPILGFAHDHAPAAPADGTDKEISFRVFKKWAKINWMADVFYSDRENEDLHKAITLGGKYRVHKNLKVGASVSRQFGNRHDDDWLVDESVTPKVWFWDDTKDRGETLVMIDAIPRMLLTFLPGERWVGEFRIRYVHNFFNSQNTIKLRPRLTYFMFRNGKPFINFFVQYENYFPLNYGEESIYEKWFYLGGIYHLNSWFKPGLYFAHKSLTWTTSFMSKLKRPTQPYEVTHKSKVFGATMIFRLP